MRCQTRHARHAGITNGSSQAMESVLMEEGARPTFGLARVEVPPFALHHEALEPT
jgi:hypothetical protein